MDYFIAGSNEQELTKNICKELRGRLLKRKISYFTGGELDVCIENADLKNKRVYMIQSIFNNANDKVIELLLLADAIRNLGGRDIIAIIPYLGYSRQDRAAVGEASSLQCLAKIIKVSGIKKIITVDLHNPLSVRVLGLPIINLATTSVFKGIIKNRNNAVIIAPDIGATVRSRVLADDLGVPFTVVKKERNKPRRIKIIDIPKIESVTNRDCYLVDDILDTGETICAVASEIKKFKPKSIYALISHGLFGGGAIQAIDESCINQVYVTNTVDCSSIKNSKINILRSNSVIIDFLKNNR
ncbi:MAG: ribose-phosphate pyrophosphokinase [Rickettsiales bacterium]|nr:ribose-phosphate pyrophosphokinase [Rickettsiales bacterium]